LKYNPLLSPPDFDPFNVETLERATHGVQIEQESHWERCSPKKGLILNSSLAALRMLVISTARPALQVCPSGIPYLELYERRLGRG
jgi:hypothetical protein